MTLDHDIQAKDAERARIERDVQAYLAKGGRIQRPGPKPIKAALDGRQTLRGIALPPGRRPK